VGCPESRERTAEYWELAGKGCGEVSEEGGQDCGAGVGFVGGGGGYERSEVLEG
jgi:hypothetical protein